MTDRRPARAFTLVEALAVTAMLGIVLPVAMEGIALSVRTSDLVRQRNAAAEVASNKLNELVVSGAALTGGVSGDETVGAQTYHWTAQVNDAGVETLHELAVEVTWEGRGQTRAVVLSTWVYDGGNAAGGAQP